MLKIDPTTNTITLTRGDSASIQVSIIGSDGTPYTPAEGDVVRFAVKKQYTDAEPLINITIPNNSLILEIAPSDTKDLKFGIYRFDIQLTTASGAVDTFIDRGTLRITEEVE